MIKISVVLEDVTLNAILNQIKSPPVWEVTCTDSPSGKTETGEWSDKELLAVLNLGLPHDADGDVDALYEIAEPLFKNWAPEVRPIP
jgi:hypothetical protein